MPGRREAGVGVASEPLQGGQNERGRLAGSCLGRGEDVAAGEDEGDSRALYRSGLCVTLLRDCGEEVGR